MADFIQYPASQRNPPDGVDMTKNGREKKQRVYRTMKKYMDDYGAPSKTPWEPKHTDKEDFA